MVESVVEGTSEHDPQFEADAHIAFILEHTGMSDWLKTALQEALPLDPIAVLNDLEILNLVLRKRSEALITGMFAK
ncbi:hypothetical protein AruPA_16295 [Acidiphilium sp. PA]|uniref:hypothetical protein n=1 Tax=Acidiphilium sp. PA TaxID=2871705 RepID=UPI002244398A|nr:hypothetical protein [Acidiphilium sp. PA]MCW8308598.1 hypothetical protein [Acidiphilium sp. PA]